MVTGFESDSSRNPVWSHVDPKRLKRSGPVSPKRETGRPEAEYGGNVRGRSLSRAHPPMSSKYYAIEDAVGLTATGVDESVAGFDQVAVASHDMREPLRMVAAFCGLLDRDSISHG